MLGVLNKLTSFVYTDYFKLMSDYTIIAVLKKLATALLCHQNGSPSESALSIVWLLKIRIICGSQNIQDIWCIMNLDILLVGL